MSDAKDLDVEALEAEAARLEMAAKDAELKPEERWRAEALDRIQAAREATAASEKRRRGAAMALRVAVLRKDAGDALLKGVDLYEYFPLGEKPAHMPACGFVIVRNPDPAAAARTHAAVETREKAAGEIAIDLVTACTVFPTAGMDAQEFRSFLETHLDAAVQLAGEVRALGGAKSRERPRGRG